MKYTFLLFVALVFAACTNVDKERQAKLSESELREIFLKDMKAYLGYLNSSDYDAAFEYMPTKTFKYVSKEQMVKLLDDLQAQGMRMTVEIFDIDEVSKVVTHDDANYCRFTYNGKITAHLSGEMLEMKDVLASSFEEQYNEGKITTSEDKIVIELERVVFAVSEEGRSDWKYVEYNSTSEKTMTLVVPQKVLDQLM